MADEQRDPLAPNTADGRFWDWWKQWPGPPDESEAEDRDLYVFLAGAVAGLEAFLGEPGRDAGEALAAGAILRREIERRMGDGPVTRG